MAINDVAIRRRAATLIEDKGWWQGRATGPGGQICCMTAVYWAANELTGRPTLIGGGRTVLDEMARRLGVSNISIWNDAPDRTVEQVLEALRA